MNKSYFVIVDPSTGKQWRGNLPVMMPGKGGKISAQVCRWLPQLVNVGQRWARETTVAKKLTVYETLRSIKPQLPALVIRQIETREVIVAEKNVDFDRQSKGWAKLFFRAGEPVAMAWITLQLIDRTDLQYVARVSSKKGCLRLEHVKHFPSDQSSLGTLFLTSDDLVMLQMLAPATKPDDIAEMLRS